MYISPSEVHLARSKAVIEAALFAAGKPLTSRELSELACLPEEEVRAQAEALRAEYSVRRSGIEIRVFQDQYVMQVRADLASRVTAIAPRELEAPLIRTLAIIAYKQPIKQSALAEIRGNKSYSHVKELERLGLISSAKAGRTRILTTTRAFTDYFGLDPGWESIKRAISKRRLGVTPMYRSLAGRLGLDPVVVNPYSPGEEDLDRLKDLELLVIAPGYTDRVRGHFGGEILEAGARTLSQLKESAEMICLSCGDGSAEPLSLEIAHLLAKYRSRASGARALRPLTSMIADVARELQIPGKEDGVTAAPDYAKLEAEILVPTHQPYDLDILERIKQRYEALLAGLLV
jgi:segregation and condensation protein B